MSNFLNIGLDILQVFPIYFYSNTCMLFPYLFLDYILFNTCKSKYSTYFSLLSISNQFWWRYIFHDLHKIVFISLCCWYITCCDWKTKVKLEPLNCINSKILTVIWLVISLVSTSDSHDHWNFIITARLLNIGIWSIIKRLDGFLKIFINT